VDDAAVQSAARDKSYRARSRLLVRALRVLDDEGDEDSGTMNMDANDDVKLDGTLAELEKLSDREIQIKVIRTDADFDDFDGKDRSDDYVSATYDIVMKKKSVERKDSVDAVVRTVERIKKGPVGDGGEDPESAARDGMYKRAHGAHKPKTAAG
jgi:hypothetical protein